MHQRHDDHGGTPPTGGNPPINEDNVIHLSPEESKGLVDALRNPPDPKIAADAMKRAQKKEPL